MENKGYFTIKELADFLGISRIAVFKRIKSGALKASKLGRKYIIPRDEILGNKLTDKQKKVIEKAVEKTVKEYGETLELLGKE